MTVKTIADVDPERLPSKGGDRGLPIVHIQVLKIRREDSRLGEDIGEGFSAKGERTSSVVEALLSPRSNRPSSPLGNKSAFGSLI
ncbi:hypothetical protein QJS10_CPB18g01345 [Acorus calamus]|uniref:Uncharacterized protein n=1 Tax=Acorus calamus TaxID=4465 RepID=A0AAV9CKI3_ACOCL|nr:hypothetical protein QJS10_CPB18g01345 [Acorus calamus]